MQGKSYKENARIRTLVSEFGHEVKSLVQVLSND